MEQRREFGQEIVETYRQPDRREVVEEYSRPLPGYKCVQAEPPRHKNRKKTLLIFLICFAVIAVLATGAAILAHQNKEPAEDDLQEDFSSDEITIPSYPTGRGVMLPIVREHGEKLTAQEIYQRVNPAVVIVMVQREDKMGVGTGVIFREDGYVITNQHVLAGASDCMVTTADGYTYPADYVASDVNNDLAVLKINLAQYPEGVVFPSAEFGDSDLLSVGDKVYAIGNPLGIELRGTLTDGIVSAINRDVWVDNRTMTLIQTNAALNSGNSGGPLINEYGQVVGINVIKMTSKYNNVEGLGFAIPSTYMERIINDLLAYGELQPEPLLGVTVLTYAEQAAEGLYGLHVEEVTPGGVGEAAGIRAGDFLLTADGEPLMSSQDLLRIRRQHYLGDEMPVTLWRDGEVLEVTMVLTDALEEAEETAPWYVEP